MFLTAFVSHMFKFVSLDTRFFYTLVPLTIIIITALSFALLSLMKNRVAKAAVKHKVNKAMSNNNNSSNNSDKCQCLLGRFTSLFGAFTNAAGIAVGIGGLAFISEMEGNTNFSIMVIANAVSLVTFSLMLLVSFTLPNERYAPLFGFLQLAAGKAILMSFAGILMIASG